MLVHLRIAGVLLLLLAGANLLVFPKYFRWRDELSVVSLFTRQVFWVHAFFIVLILALFGVLSAAYGSLLIDNSQLARVLLAGLTIFWAVRLVMQWFVYDPRIWRGNRRNTIAHICFSMLWVYLVCVYGTLLWTQLARPYVQSIPK